MQYQVDPEISHLIASRNWAEIRKTLANWQPPEIADLLLALERRERVVLFRLLPRHVAPEVGSYMEPEDLNDLLIELTGEEARRVLQEMPPDDRTSLLEELPGQYAQRLLGLLSPEDLREARHLLGYPPDSVGRLMTPDYVAVRPDFSVRESLEHIRQRGRHSETINMIYVISDDGKLLDSIELKHLILTEPSRNIESLMDNTFVSLSAFDDRELAVFTMDRYDLFVLPVVSSDNVLLGIVTADDVLDVAMEEATEDFHRAAAMAPRPVEYNEASVGELYRKRIGWLMVLVFLNLVSSSVIAIYEKTLATAIALAFFIPLLIGSGGNTGAQSATLMIRAISTGDLKLNQWTRTLLKELSVGILLGVTMGLVSSVLGLYRGGAMVGIVVGLAMVVIVLVSNIIGAVLPFTLIVFGIDPAVASSPVITTIADSAGLLIYFSIASWLLGIV